MSLVLKQIPLEEEYKKTKISPDDIRKLRSWLLTQPHLPGEYITDLDLILTFHCCRGSAEVSKQLLDTHCTVKTLFNNLFKDRIVDEKLLGSCDVAFSALLDTKSYTGDTLFLGRFLDFDVTKFIFQDVCRASVMGIELAQYEQGTWPGVRVLLDLEGISLGHLGRVELHTLQQILYFVQEAMLWNLKGIHFLNAPSFMEKLMMLIRPFVNKEFLSLIQIHQAGDPEVGKILPVEELPTLTGEFTFEQLKDKHKARLKANAAFFEAEKNKRVVESKRPGKSKTIADVFGGVEGSFKKLEID